MDTAREQRILKFSIGFTIAVSVVGFSGGLLVGSQAILFDGIYSLVDVALTLVSLSVLRLVARDARRGHALLVALVAAGQVVISHEYKTHAYGRIALGLLFGGVAILGMVNPFVFLPGVIFDGRTIVLAVAGVVGQRLVFDRLVAVDTSGPQGCGRPPDRERRCVRLGRPASVGGGLRPGRHRAGNRAGARFGTDQEPAAPSADRADRCLG